MRSSWRVLNVLVGVVVLAAHFADIAEQTTTTTTATTTTTTCASIEVRKLSHLAKLKSCQIVVGHVILANVRLPSALPSNVSSAVREITGYLLVYRVEGLHTLQAIFPRLEVVRGERLLFDKHALTIYENRDLHEIGLVALLRVQKGAIRIQANPSLCFVDTVNWMYLLGNVTEQHFFLKENRSPNHCPVCLPPTPPGDDYLPGHCWSLHAGQRTPPGRRHTDCPATCAPADGCDARTGVCCSRDCLSGCSALDCRLCANYRHIDGSCNDVCNMQQYKVDERECMPALECRRRNLIPLADVCVAVCPANYQLVYERSSVATCSPLCSGHFVVHTAEEALALKDCVTVKGSVTIELTELKSEIISVLEDVLQNVKEITGYLKVTQSPQLISLNVFRHLDTIRGEELMDNRYALYVVGNHYLEQIWAPNHNVAILNGNVYFHLNPRLCHEKIMQLEKSLRAAPKISIVDASPNSNGERVICGDYVRTLNATVEDFNATAARIKVDPMPAEEKEVLIGYLHHYKEAPVQNVNMYDGRHGCGHDNWRMDITVNQNVRHIIANLKPFTQYAYFVKTMTMTDYHMQIDAYSRIQYFTTLPSKPGPVSRIYYHSVSATEISIHWWPPRNPNGRIKSYIVAYEAVTPPTQKGFSSKHYPSETGANESLPECQCTDSQAFSKGPTPEDENYYSKEQITYDEALPNLIYVTRAAAVSQSLSRSKRKTSPGNQTVNRIAAPFKDDNVEQSERPMREEVLTVEDYEANAERIYSNLRKEIELKALRQQDTGDKDYPIVKPMPICSFSDASIQYQLENVCKPLERYDGMEVAGDQHVYRLRNLRPEVTYRITVRACVDGLENGCGRKATITAETVSRRMETLFKSYYNLF